MARRRKGSLDFGGNRPVIVAYGMGVDSTAMLVGMAEAGVRPDLILFADTGSEKYETYAYHDVIQAYLRSVGFPPVLRVAYPGPRRGKYAGQYDSLLTDCLVKRMLPSIAYPGPGRHGCSFKWKVEPQNKYVDNWEPALRAWEAGKKCVKLIGYDAGPADARRGHKFKDDPKYDYVYPLREWGWDREKCKAVIREAGIAVPLKSACFFCTAAKPHEITWLVRNHPELADIIVKMERQAMPNLKKTQGLWIRPTKCRPASMSEWIEVRLAPKHAFAYGHWRRIRERPARGNARRPGGLGSPGEEGERAWKGECRRMSAAGQRSRSSSWSSRSSSWSSCFGSRRGRRLRPRCFSLRRVRSRRFAKAPQSTVSSCSSCTPRNPSAKSAIVNPPTPPITARGLIPSASLINATAATGTPSSRSSNSATQFSTTRAASRTAGCLAALVMPRSPCTAGRRARTSDSSGVDSRCQRNRLVPKWPVGVRWETMDDQPWLLALVVAAAVQGIRDRVRRMDGWAVVACAFVCSVALVLGLDTASPLPGWAKQSLVVFVLSVGGASTVKAVGRRIWGVSNKGDTGGNHA